MRFVSVFGLLGVVALSATACSPTPQHDKPYYISHDAERAKQLEACKADPGRLGQTPNCINAQSAESDALTKDFWKRKEPASRVQNTGEL